MLLARRILRHRSALKESVLSSLFFGSVPSAISDAIVEAPGPSYARHRLASLPASPRTLSCGRRFSEGVVPKSLTFRSHGDADLENPDLTVCGGCGVYMQNENPKLPGFFIKPAKKKNPTDDESTEMENPSESVNPANEKAVVCARCHSLRYYGKVKDPSVENLLPDFDFDHYLGHQIASSRGGRSVVMMVVDATDFDGSFSRRVATLVSNTIEEDSAAWKEGKPGNVPRVVLVVTKVDLLPQSISPTAVEYWVRSRAREGGSNKLTSVHLVSAVRNWGIKNLIEDIKNLAGARGSVWAIGAQNAGKSTLINAIGKHVEGNVTNLTEAPVPGTTLGIIRVEGVLPGQAKLFDTPGLLHPHQITSRLTWDEQRLVNIRKELRPRTYRVQVGYSVHIGGLMRLDVVEAPADTIYVTVWASLCVPLHMGTIEHADTMVGKHFGRQLQPPIGEKRVEQLGKWVRRECTVSGNSWDVSSVDVAAAGLGWFAIGLKGEAVLGVWTYDGVEVTLRNSLIQHRARIFETVGFTVSKIVSRADSAMNKKKRQAEMVVREKDGAVSPADTEVAAC